MKLSILGLLLPFLSLAVAAQTIDLMVVNANIRTLDPARPRAEALAVAGERIVAIGSSNELRKLADSKTVVVDAEGKLLIPGFNDSHVHFSAMGRQFFSVDLRGVASNTAFVERLKAPALYLPRDQWILGGGWNALSVSPTLALIDAAIKDRPVLLYDSTAKIAVANSVALRLAGIDANTKDPANGVIERVANGVPSGILRGAAISIVKRFTPASDDQIAVAETASNYAASFGVTSVQDVSADDLTDVYRELRRRGTLKTRIYDCVALSEYRTLVKLDIKSPAGDSFIRRGCVKGMAAGDADLDSSLFDEIAAADLAGVQVAVHAIGPTANAQILSIFERVARKNGSRDRRFRVEHAHGYRAADAKRFAPIGIIASVQPFLFSDASGRSRGSLRDLLNRKTILAFGSDASMIAVDPIKGIAAAVNSSDPRERLTVEEAVGLYTTAPAFAEFQEKEKGALAVGKLADFVILSRDIFTVRRDEIASLKVLKTFVGGRLVYDSFLVREAENRLR